MQSIQEVCKDNPQVISFNVELSRQIGVSESIVLAQIDYWLQWYYKEPQQYERHFHDGRAWVFNTYEQWEEQLPFGKRQLVRIIKSLSEKGIVLIGNYNRSNIDKTNWYSIDYDKLSEIIASPIVTKCHHRECQDVTNNTNDITHNNPYTDNTECDFQKSENAPHPVLRKKIINRDGLETYLKRDVPKIVNKYTKGAENDIADVFSMIIEKICLDHYRYSFGDIYTPSKKELESAVVSIDSLANELNEYGCDDYEEIFEEMYTIFKMRKRMDDRSKYVLSQFANEMMLRGLLAELSGDCEWFIDNAVNYG